VARDGRCTIQLTQFLFVSGEDVSVFRIVGKTCFISTMSINSIKKISDKLICGIGSDVCSFPRFQN